MTKGQASVSFHQLNKAILLLSLTKRTWGDNSVPICRYLWGRKLFLFCNGDWQNEERHPRSSWDWDL